MTKFSVRVCISLGVCLTFLTIGARASVGATSAQYDHFVHLPLITGGSGKAQTIPNGDFEAGRTIWAESSQRQNDLIVINDALPRGISPHGGSWVAWLGGDDNEKAYIQQLVSIDPDFPYLAYWYWIDAGPFACDGSVGAVKLSQTILHQTDVCKDTDTGGWVKKVINVKQFAGQSAYLRFQLTTANSSFANWFLDDVAFQKSP